MLFVETELRESRIVGLGVFTLQPIAKGSIAGHFCLSQPEYLDEDEYRKQQANSNQAVIQSGVRLIGRCFIYNREAWDEDFLNHSENPNLLYHCGICIATRDIEEGEELTVNYRFLLAESDPSALADSETAEDVDGFSAKDALFNSTQQLLALLNGIQEMSDLYRVEPVFSLPQARNLTNFASEKLDCRRLPDRRVEVYAKEQIDAGDTAAVFGGRVVRRSDLAGMQTDFVLQVSDEYYLASQEPPDLADHINHSCEPNLGFAGPLTLIAMQDIRKGEAVCFDYAMSESSNEFDCVCGLARCRGRITGDDWRLQEVQERYRGYFSPYLESRIQDLISRE